MLIIGIFIVVVSGFISNYLIHLDSLRKSYNLPFPYEFSIMIFVFFVAFLFYYFIQRIQLNKLLSELQVLNSEINSFNQDKRFKLETKNRFLFNTFALLNNAFNEWLQKEERLKTKIQNLDEDKEKLEKVMNLKNILFCKVTESGKVIKANEKFLKFLSFESESKLNMKIKHILDIFDTQLEKDFNLLVDKDIKVTINDIHFLLHITKVPQEFEYVVTLIDVTQFEEEKNKIIKKVEYAGKNLKTEVTMNKTLETIMIKILNYENYSAYLGRGILEVFEDKFVEKIISLGYEDVYKIQDNLFAINDLHINFDKYKRVLEENIIIVVGHDKYILNPKVVLAGGVNFEQAFQQMAETSKTLIPKIKSDSKYELEFIKLVNSAILNNRIKVGYKKIENDKDILILNPIIQDEYNTVLAQSNVDSFLREFNIYLFVMKQMIVNNIDVLKHYKLMINVTSEELLAMTMLNDFLSLIRREDLMVIFNVEINSKYSIVKPILKQIKSFAQLGLRNVGAGYIDYMDIYALKIEYLEVNEKLAKLVSNDKNGKFLIDSIKLLTTGQKTRILASKYSDDKIYKISNDIKIL